LCSEKAEEWKVKLKKIGLVTAEVTGDTASDKGFLSTIKNADVIITTVGVAYSVLLGSIRLTFQCVPA
jgi:replicative superfamily II helicase